jgi:hypothetical protein
MPLSILDAVGNAIGDSFLNECFEDSPFFQKLGIARPAIFGWTESYPLLMFNLLLLIVLPTIFTKQNSPLKLSRIYNLTRLGLMSIFHQICYSYSIAGPLSLMVFQPSPCIHSATFGELHRLLNFPDCVIVAGATFSFALSRFIGWSSLPAKLLVAACLMIVVLTDMGLNEATLLQGTAAVLISYVLHFVSLHIPFRFVHIENAILALIVLAGFLAAHAHGWPWWFSFSETWFWWIVIIIDELILWRHHVTRNGFKTIERPADISWVTEVAHGESIRLLNSEEEANFPRNCRSDLVTSVYAFVGVFVGVLVRMLLQPVFFASAS